MPVDPDLREGASDDAYAKAMVMCQGYAPACSDAHECLHEGECFTCHGLGFSKAKRLLQRLIDAKGDIHARVWLKFALDALEHHQFMTRQSIDLLKVVAINKKVREEYEKKK